MVRRDLEIRAGDKLMVLKRRDGAGITLIKLRAMDELMFKIQEDEDLFSKIEEDKRGGKKKNANV